MGKGGSSWHLLCKKPKAHFPQAFPLHLKVQSRISKINLSHVFHFFPLMANCSAKAYCHVKDFQNAVFIPNEKTTLSLNTQQHSTSRIHAQGPNSHLVKYNNNLFSTDQFMPFLKTLANWSVPSAAKSTQLDTGLCAVLRHM